MDILNTSTSFPYNGHRFRVGVDDGGLATAATSRTRCWTVGVTSTR